MKKLALLLVVSLFAGNAFAEEKIRKEVAKLESAEPWKGPSPSKTFHVGGIMGLGIYGAEAGFTVLPNISARIVERGFVPDLNDSVFVEMMVGPLWVLSSTVWVYSTHLRWDFYRDSVWSLFAIGGFGGTITGASLGSQFLFHPRFGIGAFLTLTDDFKIRFDVSHEIMGAGVSFLF